MVQIKDSNDWLPALEPAHPSRGPRRTTKDFVPVVGCMVTNHQFNEPRFVLSAADVRCRASTDAATFPAECDGGASQRNVMIESTEAAISFVERTTRQSARRELGLFDTERDHRRPRRRRRAVLPLLTSGSGTLARRAASARPWSKCVTTAAPARASARFRALFAPRDGTTRRVANAATMQPGSIATLSLIHI